MDVDAELYEAARILAMEAVRIPDWDAGYRRVCRYFSQNFSTPLAEVFDLPVPFVLQHFYEALYEGMEKDTLRTTIRDAIETAKERADRLTAEAAADSNLVSQARKDAARLMEKIEAKKKRGKWGVLDPAVKKSFEDAAAKLDGILSSVPKTIAGAPVEEEDGFKIGE